MTTSKNGNTEYVDGYCQINLTLPPVGKYNYSIVIVPGETQVSPFFSGSNEISKWKKSDFSLPGNVLGQHCQDNLASRLKLTNDINQQCQNLSNH